MDGLSVDHCECSIIGLSSTIIANYGLSWVLFNTPCRDRLVALSVAEYLGDTFGVDGLWNGLGNLFGIEAIGDGSGVGGETHLGILSFLSILLSNCLARHDCVKLII